MSLDKLLNASDATGNPVCRILGPNISCHWFPQGARPGDACLCGKTKMAGAAPEDGAVTPSPRRRRAAKRIAREEGEQ